jgi:tetratricopeptide (TPR) repeat protein
VVTKKDKFLAAAQKYLERGSPHKALAELQNAVREDPKDTRTWLRMAEVHVRLGQTDKATEVYQKTVDLYVEQGFFQRAVAVYKNIIKLSPDFIDARTKLADVYRQLGLLSDAVQQLEQAATLRQKAGQVADALIAMKQIIELSPDQPGPRIRYAEMASQAGQANEAAAEFGEAAQILKEQGRVDEFLRVGERLLQYQPDNLAVAKEVAAKHLERGNGRGALARLKPCFDADPRDPDILDMLARAFEQMGQPHKCLPVLKELCRVYADVGRTAERNLAIQRVLALDPNDPEMREMMARPAAGVPRMPVAANPLRMGSPTPSPVPSPAPLTASTKRPTAITFSEMEVPTALQNKYKTPSPEMVPSVADQMAIASGLVERPEDQAEIKRILAEADVFVKYGLIERAAEHLRRVFERVPTHIGAHERLAAVLVQLGRTTEAAAELEVLAQQVFPSSRADAAGYARRALELNPACKRAAEVLDAVERRNTGATPTPFASEKTDSTQLDGAGTLEPELLGSGEIELMADGQTNASRAQSDAGDGAAALAAAFGTGEFDAETGADATRFEETPRFEDLTTSAVSKASSGGDDADEQALLADLEQVDFFIDQALYEEAQSLLDDLEARYQGHMLVADRRERLATLARGSAEGAMPNETPTRTVARPVTEMPTAASMGMAAGPDDFDSHADLGLMNKTMERHDVAIQHFTALLDDPAREVYALTMIGESHEALGNSAEAIRCYQDALKRPRATESEATQLYHQLGKVFYNLGDRTEALYYFERVSRRDPGFRDVQRYLANLKTRSAPQ